MNSERAKEVYDKIRNCIRKQIRPFGVVYYAWSTTEGEPITFEAFLKLYNITLTDL